MQPKNVALTISLILAMASGSASAETRTPRLLPQAVPGMPPRNEVQLPPPVQRLPRPQINPQGILVPDGMGNVFGGGAWTSPHGSVTGHGGVNSQTGRGFIYFEVERRHNIGGGDTRRR